jgi:hypothetical protein
MMKVRSDKMTTKTPQPQEQSELVRLLQAAEILNKGKPQTSGQPQQATKTQEQQSVVR